MEYILLKKHELSLMINSVLNDFEDGHIERFKHTFEFILFSRINKFLDTIYNDLGHLYYVKLLIDAVNNVEWIILGD